MMDFFFTIIFIINEKDNFRRWYQKHKRTF